MKLEWYELIKEGRSLHEFEQACRDLLGLSAFEPFVLQACTPRIMENGGIKDIHELLQLIENEIQDTKTSGPGEALTSNLTVEDNKMLVAARDRLEERVKELFPEETLRHKIHGQSCE